ncbi:autophagy associated lysophospholipase Atg15 [Schizosaccharomyces osmophilus]|uniref:triacylglycerol lipase n=1 Tax=Schizosaccharomyces osmophilus TaxID=2545709 RepID=A0AAE9W875_9SCHI|nr:autophagy associated lysophospholipase Atg15 [Schizosaccharomyces osmophilus]WBW71550.1 autophagy associated lysophospholipase Atg15 [Schizosaccharomyces osmophilus]
MLHSSFVFWITVISIISQVCNSFRISDEQVQKLQPSDDFVNVKLRHVFHHGLNEQYNQQYRLDIHKKDVYESSNNVFQLKMKNSNATSLKNQTRESLNNYRESSMRGLHAEQSLTDIWTKKKVVLPDVTDKATVYSLGKMSFNAYQKIPFDGDWLDIGPDWNITPPEGFGWDEDGLRGHVFSNNDNSTIIISMKGTSIYGIGRGTSQKDRINDNLLFSCCCARVSWAWTTVCDCYKSTYTCRQTCLEDEIQSATRYYSASLDIYYNLKELYPEAQIWLTGHSLGGATASLMGLSFGIPTVTFEAPGELLAARRLHLPMPPGLPDEESHIWHIGHTADPIFLGVCVGPTTLCWAGGYAMESKCHTGQECLYDVAKDKGWHISLTHHRMQSVLNDVIDTYDEVPVCAHTPNCVDCYLWEFPDDEK